MRNLQFTSAHFLATSKDSTRSGYENQQSPLITEIVNSDVHLTSHLFPSQDRVPYADRAFIHIKGQYAAPLVFVDKPGGWVDKEAELRYLWDMFARIAAQEALCEGSLPLQVAVVMIVHRPTLNELDSACRYTQKCFRRLA